MGDDQEKRAAKMLRDAERADPKPMPRGKGRKRPERAAQEPTFHWCMAVMAAGRCPRCDGRENYDLYCRNCMRVHARAESCATWTVPTTIVLLDGGGRKPIEERTRDVIREIEREARRRGGY